jgi:hypothetical protein
VIVDTEEDKHQRRDQHYDHAPVNCSESPSPCRCMRTVALTTIFSRQIVA